MKIINSEIMENKVIVFVDNTVNKPVSFYDSIKLCRVLPYLDKLEINFDIATIEFDFSNGDIPSIEIRTSIEITIFEEIKTAKIKIKEV